MVIWVVVMMVRVAGLEVVIVLELKEPILHWTQFPTCILFTKSL